MKKVLILFTQFLFVFSENIITFNEFRKAVTDNVYPTPSQEQYDTIMRMATSAGGITTKHELAMFLAQVLWESAGLQHKKEIKCASNGCPNDYRTGREKEGKYYYGRGYIQLTWLYNYEQCSRELYGDQRLVDNPELVSDTEEGAWGSAFWYWRKHCHASDGVQKGQFGASTMAINGALECKGPYKVKAFKRYTIYVKVLKAFKLNDIKPKQEGCYPMEGSEAPGYRLCDATGIHKNSVGMYHWCNDNCNAEDPNCPLDMCGCEGGNPVAKPKNQTKSEANDSRNQIAPKLVPKVSEHLIQGIRVDRVPPKLQFPTSDPYSELELSNITEFSDKSTEAPVLHYDSGATHMEDPVPPQPQLPVRETAVPYNRYNFNTQRVADILDTIAQSDPHTDETPAPTRPPVRDPVIPFRRRTNANTRRVVETHTGANVADTHKLDDIPVRVPARRPTVPLNRRLTTSAPRGVDSHTSTEAPVPTRGWGNDLFRYHEPMRISRNRGSTTTTTSTPVPDIHAVRDEGLVGSEQPDPNRTRLLRNELGRLIRKRPVVRNQ